MLFHIDLAVLIFYMLLADNQRPNWKLLLKYLILFQEKEKSWIIQISKYRQLRWCTGTAGETR